MRSLKRNQRSVYYALRSGNAKVYDENGNYTGELTETFASPVQLFLNYSAASGEAAAEVFGIIKEYQRVVSTTDTACPIAEDSRLWIGVEPDKDATNYNYIVKRRADSENSLLYLIEEVTVSA